MKKFFLLTIALCMMLVSFPSTSVTADSVMATSLSSIAGVYYDTNANYPYSFINIESDDVTISKIADGGYITAAGVADYGIMSGGLELEYNSYRETYSYYENGTYYSSYYYIFFYKEDDGYSKNSHTYAK